MTPYCFRLFSLMLIYASSTSGYTPSTADCKNFTIPVSVTSDNYPWIAPRWTDNFGFVDFLSTASSRADAGFPSPLGDAVSRNGSYRIGATLCTPKQLNGNTNTVLLATHGLLWDRRHGGPNASCYEVSLTHNSYWNSPYKPDQYNLVQYATRKNIPSFFTIA